MCKLQLWTTYFTKVLFWYGGLHFVLCWIWKVFFSWTNGAKNSNLYSLCVDFFFEMPTNHAQINCLLNGTPGPKVSLNKALLSKDWPLIYHTPFFVRILCWRNEFGSVDDMQVRRCWILRLEASVIYNSMIQVSDILQLLNIWTVNI